MTRIHLFCFAIIATLAGWHCSSAPKYDAMEFFQPVFDSCKQSPTDCTVDFAKLTNFDWDRMAFVQMQAIDAEAASAMGLKELERPEFEDWIIFILDDKLVHHVTRTYDSEKPYDHTIFLDFGERQGQWKIFPKEKAVFKVSIDQGEGIVNIDLSPLGE